MEEDRFGVAGGIPPVDSPLSSWRSNSPPLTQFGRNEGKAGSGKGSRELGVESEAEGGKVRKGCLQIGLASPRLADTAASGGFLTPAWPRAGTGHAARESLPSATPFSGRLTAELPPPPLTRAL